MTKLLLTKTIRNIEFNIIPCYWRSFNVSKYCHVCFYVIQMISPNWVELNWNWDVAYFSLVRKINVSTAYWFFLSTWNQWFNCLLKADHSVQSDECNISDDKYITWKQTKLISFVLHLKFGKASKGL